MYVLSFYCIICLLLLIYEDIMNQMDQSKIILFVLFLCFFGLQCGMKSNTSTIVDLYHLFSSNLNEVFQAIRFPLFLQSMQVVALLMISHIIIKKSDDLVLSLNMLLSFGAELLFADIRFNMAYCYYNNNIIEYPYVSLLNPKKSIEYYKFNKIPDFINSDIKGEN